MYRSGRVSAWMSRRDRIIGCDYVETIKRRGVIDGYPYWKKRHVGAGIKTAPRIDHVQLHLSNRIAHAHVQSYLALLRGEKRSMGAEKIDSSAAHDQE